MADGQCRSQMVCPSSSSSECSYPMTGQGILSQFVHMISHKVLGYHWLAWSVGIHVVGSSAWKTLVVMFTGPASSNMIVFKLGSKGRTAMSATMMQKISWYALSQVVVHSNLTFLPVSCRRGCVSWA